MRAKKNRIIAEQKIQQLENERKLTRAQAVMIGQENERKRIAHDLHDGLGVLLSTASVQFSRIKSESGDPKSEALLQKARELLNEASGEVRKISHNMMPGVLSRLGLCDALEDLFDSVNKIKDLHVDVKLPESRTRLPENTEIMVYRIVQELLNNTVKHAQATEIHFELVRKNNMLHIEYSDNGIGFDQQMVDNDGIGISGIRSRVDLLNGNLKFVTGKNKGVLCSIDIPF
jgi:two-component system NarL family sensor kinase